MVCGSTPEEADRSAATALGNAKAANRQYRRVLLTSAEARMLRQSNCEARAVCSHPWLKRLLAAIPAAVIVAATAFFFAGEFALARVLLAGGLGMGIFMAAPFLPLYTPARGRVFRVVKWVALVGTLGLVLQWSWLLISCLWPLAWIEWTRVSIRRKLPVAQWPQQLYL